MSSSSAVSVAALLLLLAGAARPTAAEEEPLLVRPPGQSLQTFGAAVTPPAMRLAHQVVSGDIGPFRQCLVVLFHPADYREFTGWVLVPEERGYRKYVLPDVQLPVSTEVRAVFFADADGDKQRDVLILARHISGIGAYPANVRPFCNTYPYTWNGTGFSPLEDLDGDLDRCTAAGVKQQLARMSRKRR